MFKRVLPLSVIIGLRFLGLFIVLPVISIYALNLSKNEILVGIVIGGYAIAQIMFQIPFGFLSDKIGRKPSILIGLLIFILGSLVCAIASDIYTLILGRFLQGGGAVGAVVIAMISDLTTEEQRAKAMAIVGMSIGAAFSMSMLLGPLIGGKWGVDKLFWITAIFAFIALVVLFLSVPTPPKIQHKSKKVDIFEVFKDKNLYKMNITNFLQKNMMTLAFLLIPILMVENFSWEKSELWKVYMPSLILGIMVMAPSVILGAKKAKFMLILGIVLFALAYIMMCFTNSVWVFIVGAAIFFAGFNIHEPLMQSMASKYSKIHQRGTALGIFNAFGYMGTFFGGTIGGYLLKHHGLNYIAYTVIITCIFWIFLILKLENTTSNEIIKIDFIDSKNLNLLENTNGIIEIWKNETENKFFIKYNSNLITQDKILSIL